MVSLVAARLAVAAFAGLSFGLLAMGAWLGALMLYARMHAGISLYFLAAGVVCGFLALGLWRKSRIALLVALVASLALAGQQIVSGLIGGLSSTGFALPIATALVICLVIGWPAIWRRS